MTLMKCGRVHGEKDGRLGCVPGREASPEFWAAMKYSGGINPDCVRPVMDSRDAEERSAARGSSEKPGEAGRQAGRQVENSVS